jgi:hypothetical protein
MAIHIDERGFPSKLLSVCISQVPEEGTPVENKRVKRAGMYLLGPVLGSSPVKSIVQCLARRDGIDDFYTLKVHCWLTLNSLLFWVLTKFLWLILLILIRKLRVVHGAGGLDGKS